MAISVDDMMKLIQAVSENGLTSFEYEQGEERIILKKKEQVPAAPVAPVVISQPAAPMIAPMAAPVAAVAAAPAPITEPVEKEPKTVDIGSDKVVNSPLVGTFYASSSPDSAPFVSVGDTVKKGQVLGIIEAMKLMNEIESEYDGVIEAILVNNEEVVEYGQPLFRIR